MWDGKTERRKKNRETAVLTKAILTANANFTGYHKDIGYLKDGIDEIKADGRLHTQEIKQLHTKFDRLPCKTLKERINWAVLSIKVLWGVIIISGLIGGAVKGIAILNSHGP